MDLVNHIAKHLAWSEKTFGPGRRTKGVLDHIRKECAEVEAEPSLEEWVDLITLSIDGAWRHVAFDEHGNRRAWTEEGMSHQVANHLAFKLDINRERSWPDPSTNDPDKATEHIRDGE